MNRVGARKPDELRPVAITLHYIEHLPSSVLIEMGKTKLICAATVDDKVPLFLKNTGSGWVTAEYSMLPCSAKERIGRESVKGIKGRTHEIQRIIGRTLRGGVNLNLLGERTILIDCDVIQADGGTRCAAITGGFCALSLAIKGLLERGVVRKNPIISFVAAVSSGIVQRSALLDLDYSEDYQASCDLNLAMTETERIIELQTTAEGAPFSFDTLNDLLSLAKKGILELIEIQKKVLS
ncbi:ribonuclease PH [bacterium]|nr:ribonuclease PH [bacterium]